jgi:hypothetical protein
MHAIPHSLKASAFLKVLEKRLAVVASMRFMKSDKIRIASVLEEGACRTSSGGEGNISQTLQNALETRPRELGR